MFQELKVTLTGSIFSIFTDRYDTSIISILYYYSRAAGRREMEAIYGIDLLWSMFLGVFTNCVLFPALCVLSISQCVYTIYIYIKIFDIEVSSCCIGTMIRYKDVKTSERRRIIKCIVSVTETKPSFIGLFIYNRSNLFCDRLSFLTYVII